MANEVNDKVQELTSFLTSTLNLHLNLGQYSQINTSQVFMAMETLSTESLANKSIPSVGNARIQFPEDLTINHSMDSLSLRVRNSISFEQEILIDCLDND